MNYQSFRDMVILDEGLRLKPYTDSNGHLTIGVGRNLDAVGISNDEAMVLLDNDIKAAIEVVDQIAPWWRGMSEMRQHVLVNMAFNLGYKLAGFKRALTAMEAGAYETAADEMKNSEWYRQVGARGVRLVSLMRQGK